MAQKGQVAFLLHKDQKEIIDELTDEEAGIIFKSIYEYVNTKKEPKLSKTLRIVFKQFRIKIDSYAEAYQEKCLKNKESAEKRWGKDNNANACERIRTDANKIKINKNKLNKIKLNEIKLNNINTLSKNIISTNNIQRTKEEKEKIKEREKEREKKPKKESVAVADSPTPQNILSFGLSFGVSKEYCEKFYNHYEAIGWVNGTGQPIKNWKLVFKNWMSRDKIVKNKETKKVDEGVFKL